MAVAADQKNPDLNVIYVGQSGLGLPSKEYYEEEEILATYKETIKNMLSIVFDQSFIPAAHHNKERNFDATAEMIVEFEKELAKVTVPS